MAKAFGSAILDVDLHGCTVAQARLRLNRAIAKAGGDVYKIRAIHGHRNGVALKNFVKQEYINFPGVLRIDSGLNSGETLLVIREY